jgi:hypothetical protein
VRNVEGKWVRAGIVSAFGDGSFQVEYPLVHEQGMVSYALKQYDEGRPAKFGRVGTVRPVKVAKTYADNETVEVQHEGIEYNYNGIPSPRMEWLRGSVAQVRYTDRGGWAFVKYKYRGDEKSKWCEVDDYAEVRPLDFYQHHSLTSMTKSRKEAKIPARSEGRSRVRKLPGSLKVIPEEPDAEQEVN